MKMNPIKKILAGAGGVATLALLGAGVFGVQDATAGIANTKHNLGSSGTVSGANKFDGTAEICVFCHTPHGSDTTAAVPLWNRKLGDATSYTTYNSLGTSSLDGATVQVGSVSLACLSCHDGTQAMNAVINKPGSGGYVAGGSDMLGGWTGTNQQSSKLGNAAGDLISMLGKDLKNDHPVGIQYGGGPKTVGTIPTDSVYANTLFNDPDFNSAQATKLNGQPVWWVDTMVTGSVAGSREKTDMLLYTRSGASAVKVNDSKQLTDPQPFVECASCHDPHTENVTFLRIVNSGSAVCLACHIK